LRALALSAVVDCLPLEAMELLSEALHAARAIRDEGARARVLNVLVERLPTELLAEALHTAQALGSEDERTDDLNAAIERLLPEATELPTEALPAVQMLGREGESTDSALAERLLSEATELLVEELCAARALGNEGLRAYALSAVAGRLPPEVSTSVLAEALSAARAIGDERSRTYALSAIASLLPPQEAGVQFELLQEARVLVNQAAGSTILKSLAPHWSGMCSAHGRSEAGELSETLHSFSNSGRPRLLEALEAVLSVIMRLGGEAGLQETALAIIETARWWP
jgi:hypothetical protein